MKVAFQEHGGDITWASERYGLAEGDFIDFSSNVNPLGPPRAAIRAAKEAIGRISRYPDPHGLSLKRELADYLDLPESSLVLGNGSSELIHHVVWCLRPSKVTVVAPAFSEYERASSAAGIDCSAFLLSPSDGFALDKGILTNAGSKTDMLFFCNPASPSGVLYGRESLTPALEALRENGGTLVVDESFMGFCPRDRAAQATMVPEVSRGSVIVVSTLTKIFALAGVRGPGFLVASDEIARELERKAVPWRVNSVAAAAAGEAVRDDDYLVRTRKMIPVWRGEVKKGLEKCGLFAVYPSEVNFLLLRLLNADIDGFELTEELGRRGILVRNCFNFRGLDSGFIRVAVLSPDKNAALMKALEEVI